MPKKENDTPATGKNTYFVSLLAGFLLAIATPAQATVVEYTKLTERLRHGEPITIVGNLSDFERDTTKVQDIMHIRSITLHYQVEDLAAKSAKAEITTDGRWQVVLEKLPEKSQVVFTFQISGQLKDIDQLINDTEFEMELQRFIDSSADKEYAARAYYAEAFAKAVLSIAKRQMPEVELVENETLRWSLERQMSLHDFGPLRADSTLLDYAGVPEGSVLSEIYKKVSEKLKLDTSNNTTQKGSAREFIKNYKILKNALKRTFQKDILVKVNFSGFTETTDVKTYYGIDIGAIRLPELDELRSFSTVNIYFGAAEATPEPFSVESWGSFGRFLGKRSSLTVGFSLNDISGGSQSDIKGNNAFLFGLGFRINRYFRITAGRSFYRKVTPGDDQMQSDDVENRMQRDELAHTCFWGLSIDLFQLQILQTLPGIGTAGTSSD